MWTIVDINEGDEMLCNYKNDYKPVTWYDALILKASDGTPLSQLPELIEPVRS